MLPHRNALNEESAPSSDPQYHAFFDGTEGSFDGEIDQLRRHHEGNFGGNIKDVKELLDLCNAVSSDAAELQQLILTADTFGRRIHVGISTSNKFQKQSQFQNVWENVDWFGAAEEGDVVNCYLSFMGPAGIRLRMAFIGTVELLPPLAGTCMARMKMSLRQACRVSVIQLRAKSLLRDILVESVKMDEITFEKRFFDPLLALYDNPVFNPMPERERRKSKVFTSEQNRRIVNKKGVKAKMALVRDLWNRAVEETSVQKTRTLLDTIVLELQRVTEYSEKDTNIEELYEFLSAYALRFDNILKKHAWLQPPRLDNPFLLSNHNNGNGCCGGDGGAGADGDGDGGGGGNNDGGCGGDSGGDGGGGGGGGCGGNSDLV